MKSTDAGKHLHHQALVPFTAKQMYTLVADVPMYSRFLPWCTDAQVHHLDEDIMQATLTIAKGPLRKRFTTRNELFPDQRIEIQLIDGPFHHLHACWQFEALGDAGSWITLDMEFQVAGALLSRALTPLFAEIGNTMVDAFCKRARDLYASK
jgi:ribosome-associated toxin RatA of RatAB toxin-antitoxin module